MRDDIILNKAADLDRCLERIRTEYFGFESEFETELRRQDSIVLNLTRACESAIDLANHLVKTRKLGIPQTSRESFELLQAKGLLSDELCQKMKNMVGFRNIAIHSYTRLNYSVVRTIVEKDLNDFEVFLNTVLHVSSDES
jgi:uncharacterized protein YutE (UPF0331/DUF86 family)